MLVHLVMFPTAIFITTAYPICGVTVSRYNLKVAKKYLKLSKINLQLSNYFFKVSNYIVIEMVVGVEERWGRGGGGGVSEKKKHIRVDVLLEYFIYNYMCR